MAFDRALLMECYAAALLADWGFLTSVRIGLPASGGGNATDTDALGTAFSSDAIRHLVFSVTTEVTAPYRKLLTAMGVAYYLQQRLEHENLDVKAYVAFAHGGRPELEYPVSGVTVQPEATVTGPWAEIVPVLEELSPYQRGCSGSLSAYLRAFAGLMSAIEGIPAADRRPSNLCRRHRDSLRDAANCNACQETGFLRRAIAGHLHRHLFGAAAWLAPAERDELLLEAHFHEQRLFKTVAEEIGARFDFHEVSDHPEAVHAGTLQTLSRLSLLTGACEAAIKRARFDSRPGVELGDWGILHVAEGRRNYEATVDWLVERLDVAAAAPRILQHFLWVQGGFFTREGEYDEVDELARLTESTSGLVYSSLDLFNRAFPFSRGWMQNHPTAPVRYLILTPRWIRGLGVINRRLPAEATYREWRRQARCQYAWYRSQRRPA